MSEFYFDYKCIALGGPDVKKGDKALDFFLFQDYKKETMKVQVYIPPELQKRNNYSSVSVYFTEHGMGFPSLKSFSKPQISKEMFSGKDSISQENGLFIEPRNNQLSSTGIIAFIRQGNSEPLEEDCYKFAINYTKREVISYSVEEGIKNITVYVRYPRLLKDINLMILFKTGCKPLFIGDRENEDNILKNPKTGEPYIIRLKKLGGEFTWTRKKIRNCFPKVNDFRITFEDENDNKFYMLLDDSDFTNEDKRQRKEDISRKKKNYLSERRYKCPYCNCDLPSNVISASRGVYTCSGTMISNKPLKYDKRKKYIYCDKDLVSESSKEIVVNNLLLPEKSDVLPSMNIAVAGFPECGKTIYLASVFNMYEVKSGNEVTGYGCDPFTLDVITKNMCHKDNSVKYVSMLNVEGENVNTTQEDKRGRFVDGLNVKGRFTINVGQGVEKQTLKDIIQPLSWEPIGFQMGDLGFTYFYDVSGEAFKDDYKEKIRTFDIADGIIAIINGDDVHEGDGVSHKENKNPIFDLKKSLDAIKRLARDGVDLVNMPIAIVFTKLDLKISSYLSHKTQALIDRCFEENCHVLREDMISLFPKNGAYRGSELERHIDCSSYEIQHYLKSLSAEDISIYNEIIKEFKNIKFFACSALGSDDVFDKSGENAIVKYRPRRLRVELPIVWLMHKKGLIGK